MIDLIGMMAGAMLVAASQAATPVPPSMLRAEEPIDCPTTTLSTADRSVIGTALTSAEQTETPATVAAYERLQAATRACQTRFAWSDAKAGHAFSYGRANIMEVALRNQLSGNHVLLAAADRTFRKMTPEMKATTVSGKLDDWLFKIYGDELKLLNKDINGLTYDEGRLIGMLLSSLAFAEQLNKDFSATK